MMNIAGMTHMESLNKEGITEEWEFTEWAHGVTGKPMGKAYQAWSAAQYIAANPNQACPASWKPGEEALTPSLDLVGKI